MSAAVVAGACVIEAGKTTRTFEDGEPAMMASLPSGYSCTRTAALTVWRRRGNRAPVSGMEPRQASVNLVPPGGRILSVLHGRFFTPFPAIFRLFWRIPAFFGKAKTVKPLVSQDGLASFGFRGPRPENNRPRQDRRGPASPRARRAPGGTRLWDLSCAAMGPALVSRFPGRA